MIRHVKLCITLSLALVLALALPTLGRAQPIQEEDETDTIILSKQDAEIIRMLMAVREYLDEYFIRDLDRNELYEALLRGMLESLGDRYSQYLTETQMRSLSSDLEGEFGGIGVTLELVDGYITVVSAFSGSPAEQAGLQAGDIFVSAGGVDLQGRLPQDAAEVLRGEPGTHVEAVVLRPSTGELIGVSMTRAIITPPSFELEDLGGGLFYLEISQFTETVGANVPTLIKGLRQFKGLTGLIIDLRNNPGGYLEACVNIAKELVPQGPIVELRRKELREVIENEQDTSPVPTVVLVNNGSASASEILAGAIQDTGVGILVGEQTFGKGSVQSIVPLGGGNGGIKLSIAEYFTPSGKSLQDKGLTPDVEVKPQVITLPSKPVFKRPLNWGSVGLDVLGVQECLRFLGYDTGEADGVYGPKTYKGLSSFAKDRNISFSGTVSEKYVDMLYASVLQHAKEKGDTVRDTALSLLKRRIDTGRWGTASDAA